MERLRPQCRTPRQVCATLALRAPQRRPPTHTEPQDNTLAMRFWRRYRSEPVILLALDSQTRHPEKNRDPRSVAYIAGLEGECRA